MIIKVTNECLDGAVRGSVLFCPIAKAMRLMGLSEPYASRHQLSWWGDRGQRVRRTPPPKAKAFMRAYDEDGSGGPFQFSVRDPA